MSYEKVRKQIAGKPAKLARFVKHNTAKKRRFGKVTAPCRKCGRSDSVTHKYRLNYCRQCFREDAVKLGFKKFS